MQCADICVSGSIHPHDINGRYSAYDIGIYAVSIGPEFFCTDCMYGNGLYLYPYIMGLYGPYHWHITDDVVVKTSATNFCAIDDSKYSDEYMFDVNDCGTSWLFWNPSLSLYEADTHLIATQCEPKVLPSCNDKCYYHNGGNVCSDDCDCRSTQTCNLVTNECEGSDTFFDAPSCIGPPTLHPTAVPTMNPTLYPSVNPTLDPSLNPSIDPTLGPSSNPTVYPTIDPTLVPTYDPTLIPSTDPTANPTS